MEHSAAWMQLFLCNVVTWCDAHCNSIGLETCKNHYSDNACVLCVQLFYSTNLDRRQKIAIVSNPQIPPPHIYNILNLTCVTTACNLFFLLCHLVILLLKK